jgi:hypothetical protein
MIGKLHQREYYEIVTDPQLLDFARRKYTAVSLKN